MHSQFESIAKGIWCKNYIIFFGLKRMPLRRMNDAALHWATRRLHIAPAHAAGTNQQTPLGTRKLTRVTFALRFAVSGVYSLPRLSHAPFFPAYFSLHYGFWSADSDCTTLSLYRCVNGIFEFRIHK